jgi:uncharacterized membrane protein
LETHHSERKTAGPHEDTVSPLEQTIASIATLHARSELQVSWHQRTVESVTATLGRPVFLYAILTLVVLWIGVNLGHRYLGIPELDRPPFYWLQGAVTLGALLMTTVVLITQNRQGKIAERRAQLDLQINLLAEQKITKLIALVEELRRDLPIVQNRHDPEAEAMTQAADPQAVLEALEETLQEALHGEG